MMGIWEFILLLSNVSYLKIGGNGQEIIMMDPGEVSGEGTGKRSWRDGRKEATMPEGPE